MRIPAWPVHRKSPFAKLLQIRWLGQFTDGLFQSALASFVLFSPERQPSAVSAALAFSVVLLPYSLIGPYAGIFLDRFSRRNIVAIANIFRAVDLIIIAILLKAHSTGIVLTLFVLVAFGINRLILAGLSAGLPLIVERDELITANALAVTGGTIFVVIGGGVGIGFKNILDHTFGGDTSDATLVFLASASYLLASFLTNRLTRMQIGPQQHEVSTAIKGWKEMLEGFTILKGHGDALRGIFATAIQRGGLTSLTLVGLLLERNTYNPPNNPDAGLRGFAFALAIAGVGIGLGSFISPLGVIKHGRHKWIKFSLIAPIPFLIIFAFYPNEAMLITTAFFVGMFGQSVKVTNDALVQTKIKDEYRGRIFAFYDVAVNGAIVGGAVLAALILPKSGISKLLEFLIAAIYLITSALLLKKANFSAYSHATN
jgi:MFS family permease